MNKWIKSGAPWVWSTAGAVSLSLIAVIGLLGLISWRGLSYFWPAQIYEWQVQSERGAIRLIGEVHRVETVSVSRIRDTGVSLPKSDLPESLSRYLVKVGNRERSAMDFRWVLETDIVAKSVPADAVRVVRRHNGNFYGYYRAIEVSGLKQAGYDSRLLTSALDRRNEIYAQIRDIESYELPEVRLALDRLKREQTSADPAARDEEAIFKLQQASLLLETRLLALKADIDRDALYVETMEGESVRLPLGQVIDVSFPNRMSYVQKWQFYLSQIGSFIGDDPREGNTEGGVYPAIFGTIFMVLLMALIVSPFGVLAAIYLHEYAGKNWLTRTIRIAVINLAGVPSIVYGVFGLGFFVYMLGGQSGSPLLCRCTA